MSDGRARGLLSATLATEYTNRGDFERAERLALQALEAPAPPLESVLALRVAQYEALGIARHQLGKYSESIDALREAERLIDQLGLRSYQAVSVLHFLAMSEGRESPADGLETSQRAIDLAREVEADPSSRGHLSYPYVLSNAYALLGAQLVELGRMDEAVGALDTALAIGQRRGWIPSVAANNRARAAIDLGDPAHGVQVLEPVLEDMIEEFGADYFAVWQLRATRGYARARMGDPQGLAELREAHAWFEARYGPDHNRVISSLVRIGDGVIESDPDEARRLFDRAYQLRGGSVTTLAGARSALRIAEAYSRVGDRARARPFAAEARAFFEQINAPGLAERAAAAMR